MENKLKEHIKKLPLYSIIKSLSKKIRKKSFPGSRKYWEKRYATGGNSGAGSYGKYAQFKAEILNTFIKDNHVNSVIEFGCGDGNQLLLANYSNYIGLDVSATAIKICTDKFKKDKTKRFFLYDTQSFQDNHSVFKSDLTLSLDVVYHLIEDDIFKLYMKHLFLASQKFVIIYSSDFEEKRNAKSTRHATHRNFSKYVNDNFPAWKLIKKIKNKHAHEGFSTNFYIYNKTGIS